jgi:hypothetical protein
MATIRETAIKILDEIKPKLPIGSNDKSPDKKLDFTRYTGYTQTQLETLWAGGSGLTTCNEFVNWYSGELARRLGKTSISLGNFSTEGWLAKNGKHHAWVRPTEGAMPLPGDIYRPVSFHMGVAYSCASPGDFVSIDSGQGGPKAKQDIIKMVTRPFAVNNFIGWVDIEALFTDPVVHPIPSWLVGWWEISLNKSKSWYFFNSDYTVTKSLMPPAKGSTLPAGGEKIKFSIEFNSIFILSWPKKTKFGETYVVEKFGPKPFAGNDKMDGERDGVANLTAIKQ